MTFLKKLVAQKNKIIEQSSVKHNTIEQSQDSVKQNESFDSGFNDTLQNAHETFFETTGSDNDDDFDLYIKALKLNQPQYLDKIYGVRNEKGKFFIGNLPISFDNNEIEVNEKEYPKTTGLLELLIAKQPNKNNISPDDLKNYHTILNLSFAYKKRHDKNERFVLIIVLNLIILLLQFSILPREQLLKNRLQAHFYRVIKLQKKHTVLDYVYWDDLNELVDRFL